MLQIILLTYKRTGYALRTIKAIKENLIYDGKIAWHVADDGSDSNHVHSIINEIGEDYTLISARKGYGALANEAWMNSKSNVTLWIEDDWELRHKLDVTPYVKMLNNRDDIGVVRLGHMPINLDLESMGHDGRMYLDVKFNRQYAFSGNPHLKHKRAWSKWGPYPVGLNPGNTEISYDGQIRRIGGLKIVWPLAIGDRFLFAHIGEEKSY